MAIVELPYFATEITTPSSPFALSLAKYLHSIGAKMYGAFWCSHCQEQKEQESLHMVIFTKGFWFTDDNGSLCLSFCSRNPCAFHLDDNGRISGTLVSESYLEMVNYSYPSEFMMSLPGHSINEDYVWCNEASCNPPKLRSNASS
ncbi:hypothetical protein TSUD_135210 [Trifolium subterraneum]|uniref:Uncharacterized protein n=1 Tax=Trifolium subterraneum TaxID=3900 RepID=A0A2Z6PGH7_TRISU|nr:hypothetical protein TSUD_135210 [Trifolium subterraneum]